MQANTPNEQEDPRPMKEKIRRFIDRQGLVMVMLAGFAVIGGVSIWAATRDNAAVETPPVAQVQESPQSEGQRQATLTVTPQPTPAFPTTAPTKTPETSAKPNAGSADGNTNPGQAVSGNNGQNLAQARKERLAKLTMTAPVADGTLLKAYAADELLYSQTLNQWETHNGLDIAAAEGADVVAVLGGKVQQVYKDGLMGNCLVLSHEDNLRSVYAGLQDVSSLKVGDEVAAGEIIGKVGNTALAEYKDGAHLHFELYMDDEAVNPNELFKLDKPSATPAPSQSADPSASPDASDKPE
jgi:murein DD-endopeptidase MepM/ murein hydrolase activator NlpD